MRRVERYETTSRLPCRRFSGKCMIRAVTRRLMLTALALATMAPSQSDAQTRNTSDFLDAMLRDIHDFRTERGTSLTPSGARVLVDLTGLDTALATLGLVRQLPNAELQRTNPRLRLARYDSITTCRQLAGTERCVLPAGVVIVRFFSPKALSANAVTFLLGSYERRPGHSEDSGTYGVVFEVVARRGAAGWHIESARPLYVS